MKPRTSCPNRLTSWIKAPATSASPPDFAYGMISELKMQSFNADIVGSLANASTAPRETWCAGLPSVAGCDWSGG